MKKNILFGLITVLLSFVFIFSVLFLTQTDESNGFKRVIRQQKFEITKTLRLPSTFFYFAGSSQGGLFLKDLVNTDYLFSIDYSLSKLNKFDLKLKSDLSIRRTKINIGVQDSVIYITNRSGDLRIISRNTRKKYTFKNSGVRFDQSNFLSNNFIGVREIIKNGNELNRRLTKLNYSNGVADKTYLLKKQVDGFFCTDGLLQYDYNDSMIVYLYFYRGEFLSLDTNLNLLYQAKTIDTVKTAKIKISRLIGSSVNQNETFLTQSSPPKFVNRNYTIYKNRIYILSALKADNEETSDFRKNQIVDVYSLSDGKYINSFYIPNYKHIKLQEFRIIDNFIIAVFDNYIVKMNALSPILD